MNTPEDAQLDLESRIHALICGFPGAADRTEILARIAADDAARELLAEMLDMQRAARGAFNYDLADAAMRGSLSTLGVSLRAVAEPQPGDPVSRRPGMIRRFASPAYLWRAAAVVAIAISSYAAFTAHRASRSMQEQLASNRHLADSAAMTVTEADLAQCRLVWRQVSGNANTWVLLSNGEGQFGSILADAQTAPAVARVLMMQFWVLDGAGRCVGKTTLLLPEKQTLDLRLPDVGNVGGQPASLVVARSGSDTIVNLSVGGQESVPVGVTARTVVGANDDYEVGSFRLKDQRLRLFVKTEHLGIL